MFDLDPVVLGILLLILGLSFFLLARVVLRLLPKLRPLAKVPPPPPPLLLTAAHNEAVLLIQSGGRVSYINQQARELFNVWEEEPNLESLARRTRPSESFLTLCASEGQARFTLNGRFVEGTSYFAPMSMDGGIEKRGAVLVSLRRPQLIIESDSPLSTIGRDQEKPGQVTRPFADVSTQAFNIFSEVSQAMAASLDLEKTLQTILESVERLLPSDFLEITIWEPENQLLVPYRLVGLTGLDRHIEKGLDRYQADQGYSGYLISNRQPLLVREVSTFREARPALDRQRYPFQSYLGIPLLIAGEPLGTLELASLSKENYSESDLEVLRLLSGQATVALNNALLYKQELLRSTELAGLANLAQTVSALRDPQDLYAHLVESIHPLIPVDILGFLIYDESRRVLEGQPPFAGIQSTVIVWYQVTIQPDSPAEEIWQKAEAITATNAPEDPTLMTLGLHHLAQAAGIRYTLLVPLTSGGRMLGYLQAANKRDGTPFDHHDLRFLSIIAGQAAPIIENVTLVQQSQRRAQRAETLRRIASLIGSNATLEEILKFSILDLARLLQADVSAIFLVDASRGELRIHKGSVFGISPDLTNRLAKTPIDNEQFKLTVTGSMQQYLSCDLSEAGDVPPLYRSLVDALEIRSLVCMPLIMHERGIGEFMVGNFRPNFFSAGDVLTVETAGGQLASAIEQSLLSAQTDQNLMQRVEQLTALTRVSRELNTTLQLEPLLQRIYDEALHTTRADCGTILLFDLGEARITSISQADPAPSSDLQTRISLYFGDEPGAEIYPLEKLVHEEGESIILSDFEAEVQFNPNARVPPGYASQRFHPAHVGVRSALVVPITHQGQVAGMIHLHARDPNHFGDTEREIGEALAIQAGIALGNTHRYQEQLLRGELLNRRVETLSRLLEVSQVLQVEQPLEHSLEAIADAIQSSTPFEVVLISLYDPQNKTLRRISAAGIPLATMDELRARPQPWESLQKLLSPEFRVGLTYFIPYERSPVIPPDIYFYNILTASDLAGEEHDWHPDDILCVPLYSTGGEPLGLISVDAPRNKLRPDRPTIEALEIFSSQAALIIESQLKIRAMRAKVEKIQGELELAQATANKAQKHLPALLHKDLEQTLFIHHLSQRARRITAGLDIAEIVSKQPARSEVLTVLGRETLRRMDFDTVLVAEPTPGGLSLTQILGAIPGDINPKALLGQRNPLRQCLQTGEVLLVSDVSEDEEWQSAPLLRALDTRSFLCLPINEISDGQVKSNGRPARLEAGQGAGNAVAAMLAVSRTPVAPFNDEDEQLYNLLTRQVSIALQNLKLLEDTHHRLKEVNLLLDFSLRLGSLDPASILRALLENAMSAVSNAKGAMVALWDDRQGLLIPQAVSGYANDGELMQVCYQPGEGLPGQVFEQKRALRLDEMNFARHYNLRSENLLHYRNATGGHLPVSGLAVPILAWLSQQDLRTGLKPQDETDLYRDEKQASPLGVLVLDNAQTTAAFTEDDLAVVASLAQQTALMLENARLYQASKQHSVQLQALTEVSTAITSNLKKEELIATLLDRLQAVIPFDTGTLWLRQKEGAPRTKQSAVDRMVVHAAHGFEDSDQRVGLAVDIQDSELLKEMIQTGRPLWVANIQQDARFRALSMMEDFTAEAQNAPASTAPGPERLSWLGVPLVSAAQVIGVIALEKAEPNFYSQDDIQVISAFAGQAAIGLENAELYQESVDRALELDKRSQTLAILNRLSSELSSSLDANTILDYAVREFMQIMPCTSVSALMIDSGVDELEVSGGFYPTDEAISRVILQTEYPPTGLDETSPYRPGSILPNTPLLTRLLETQGIFNTENIEQEPELAPLEAFLRRYSTYSLLIVPIISGSAAGDEAFVTRRRFHGLLLAHNSQPYRFSMGEIELARTISNQVAIALQNALLFEETRNLTADLEIRVQQRTSELEREHQRSETLLRIITELSASLDLDQVLHRTLHVLSEFVDAEQITILIARPGEEKLYRLASIGYTLPPAEEGAPTSLDIDQGLAGWIITQRQSVLVDDVREDDRWIKLAYPQAKDRPAFEHRSAIGVPLMSGAEALGCLLLYHPAVSHFSIDQLDLVQAAANQVAIAVNNAELYRLIRDQAEDLGNMLRTQQIETSRSKAILEAVADGVLVTDAKKLITLFNESAEKILGLSRTQLLGKSMEHFSGLFGRATRSWIEKIETWSQDPTTYQPGSTYIEQILLEDGRVISVHLSPVILRNDFLGTVSIFQDITHQVEVNRLKSEFVATVSHELRTPMTSIKGYVDILLMGAAGALNDQQRRFLQVVKENSERLTILVNDLLDISQIEAGRLRLSIQPLNLEELVAQAVTELKQRIQGNEKQATIQIVSQPNLPRVLGDPERIRRILDNLLDNAYQYNLQNGQITVKMQPVGSGVQVDIKDTGVGIHPGDQSQVFERFFRGENPLVLGVSGTGLGLAIVQNLVQMQNGRIWVESAGIPGEGSTFSFTLPIYIPENG